MDKENEVYPYNGILFWNKKECSMTMLPRGWTVKTYAKGIKAVMKDHKL